MTEPILQNPDPIKFNVVTHKQGVEIASRWLKNRCNVILPEFVTIHNGEICDVLGFNARDSHMIEVKVSRADFLKDKQKLFRAVESKGMGNYRYYCCPKGLIDEREIPDGWGLIYIYPSGKARIVVYALRKEANMDAERTTLYAYARRAVVRGLHPEIMKTLAEGGNI